MSEHKAEAQPWQYEVTPAAQPYYDRLNLPTAIQIAKEMVEEWSYADDAHGYCHNRSVLVRLIEALDQSAPPERVT